MCPSPRSTQQSSHRVRPAKAACRNLAGSPRAVDRLWHVHHGRAVRHAGVASEATYAPHPVNSTRPLHAQPPCLRQETAPHTQPSAVLVFGCGLSPQRCCATPFPEPCIARPAALRTDADQLDGLQSTPPQQQLLLHGLPPALALIADGVWHRSHYPALTVELPPATRVAIVAVRP